MEDGNEKSLLIRSDGKIENQYVPLKPKENSPSTSTPSTEELRKNFADRNKYLSSSSVELNANGVFIRKKRVQFKDIEILEQIAEGPIGKVFKANWKKYGMIVALREVKHITPDILLSPDTIRNSPNAAGHFGTMSPKKPPKEKKDKTNSFDYQIRTLRKISLHPNVLRIFGYVEDRKKQTTYIVTEYMPLGDLGTLIKQGGLNKNEIMDEKLKIKMLIDIATGLCHIHNCRVLHQNLVIHNILVGSNYGVKIADFGYSVGPKVELNESRSYKSIAPEYIEKKIYTKKGDVYAFGLIAIELFAPAINNEKQYVKIIPTEPLPFLPAAIRPIVLSCLEKEPGGRPTFSRIVDLLEDYFYSNWVPEEKEKETQMVSELHQKLKDKEDEIKQRDEKIQHLMERIKALEEKEIVIQGPEPERIQAQMPSSVQESMSNSFRGKLKIPWEDFSQSAELYLNCPKETIEKLKYLLIDSEGLADKNLWDHLLSWFSPLYPNGTSIEVNSTNKDEPFYIFQDVVDICAQSWFFGWMSPVDTNKMLLGQSSGTFLFRFSSFSGWYTLSVSNEGQVGHWRIKSMKGANWTAFLIDERRYNSLDHIIQTHLVEPLKVNTARSTQRPIRLEFPSERREKNKQSDTIYSMF